MFIPPALLIVFLAIFYIISQSGESSDSETFDPENEPVLLSEKDMADIVIPETQRRLR